MRQKITFIYTKLDMGGEERILLNTLKLLSTEKYEIKLILTEDNGDLEHEIPDYVNTIYCNIKAGQKKFSQRVFWDLIGYKKDQRRVQKLISSDEILIIVQSTSGFMNKLLLNVKPLKKIGWMHVAPPFSAWKEKLKQKAHSTYDYFFSVSKDGMDYFLQYHPNIDASKVSYIYNPIDIDVILQKAEQPIDIQGNYMLSVGRLSHEKGCDILIKAYHLAKQKNSSLLPLFIIGDGNKRKDTELLIKQLKLEQDVKLLGLIQNPYPYFKKASFYVNPSRSECLPTVLLEALLLNIPVLATDCRVGPSEILQNGTYGMLVETENIEALAQGIEKMSIPATQQKYRGIGVAYVKESFNTSLFKEQFEKILTSNMEYSPKTDTIKNLKN